jgi:large-conductance mechanosensitive channel
MENKTQMKRREIRRYEQAVNELEKPEKRITKNQKRLLLAEAVIADFLDGIGGAFVPILGDLAAPFVFYQYFKLRFQSYDVDASEFLESGTGGRFGKISMWVFDTVIGFFPVIGDIADFLVASWIFTIYTTTNKIQQEDEKRKQEYKQQIRQYKRSLQQNMRKIEQSDQRKVSSIRQRQ